MIMNFCAFRSGLLALILVGSTVPAPLAAAPPEHGGGGFRGPTHARAAGFGGHYAGRAPGHAYGGMPRYRASGSAYRASRGADPRSAALRGRDFHDGLRAGSWQRAGWHGGHEPFLAVTAGRGAWDWRGAWGFGGFGWGPGWGWDVGWGGWAWGGLALGFGVGLIVAPPLYVLPPPIYYAPPPIVLGLPAIAPAPALAPPPPAPQPQASAALVGAAVPPPIVVQPPPAVVVAAAPPPVIFAPPTFAFAIAPPWLAFAAIDPLFWSGGYITGGYIANDFYGGFWNTGYRGAPRYGGAYGWRGTYRNAAYRGGAAGFHAAASRGGVVHSAPLHSGAYRGPAAYRGHFGPANHAAFRSAPASHAHPR